MLQSSRLEDHMKTIGIYQSLFTKYSFEHRCMNNIKKIYRHAGKCDYQQFLKDIIDAAMVSTPEGFTDNSPNAPMKSTPVKKPIARKSLFLFTNRLNVKPKTSKRGIGAAKSKRRTMKVGTSLWTKKKQKGIHKSTRR